MKRAFRGRLLTPLASGGLRYLEDGLLVVAEDGRIDAVDRFTSHDRRAPVLDLRPALIVPGFVDAHLHFPQTRVIGSASGPLLRWLERTVFPEEARFRDEVYARTVARELVARLIAAGTTTSSIFSSSDPRATAILFEELAASGLRATAGLTLMDQACPPALSVPEADALAACEALADAWHGFDRGRLGFAVTPRFALSCSRGLMEGAARFAADRGLIVQTHVAENAREGVETLLAHPYARDYLGVYEAVGLLGPRTLLAHAIHLSGDEWDRVAAAGARVVHCPDSNFFLGSGRMRMDEPRSRGVPVALGSDVAAGRAFDMRRAIASAYDNALCVSAPVTPSDLFIASTLDGARALGAADVTGSLEPGKDADFAVLALPEHVTSEGDVVGHVAFAGDSAGALRAYVRGRRLEADASRRERWTAPTGPDAAS